MNREKIIAALESGDYRIEHDCECNCSVDDISTEQGVEVSGNECWQSNSLYVDDVLIAEYTQYDGRNMHTDEIDADDIPEDIWGEMSIGDTEDNPSHDVERIILAHLQYLGDGWTFYRDNLRGFANEYTIILVAPGIESVDGKNISELAADWDTLTAAEAAHKIAYNGDAATTAYNSVRVIG